MEDILIKAAQLILSLSILVILHEFGHFIPAKLFGVRVEKFYLFFNPWFSLFKKKIGDTEYGVGWIPLGGYVKLAGMIDESMDKEQLQKPPEPWEFRSKPAWQRLIIMVGGVFVNLILGIFIYSMMLYVWGENYLAVKDVKYGVHVSGYLKTIGFEDGDKIIAINDDPVPDDYTYSDVTKDLLLESDVHYVEVVRNGEKIMVNIPEDFGQKILASGEKDLFIERIPFIADTILPGSPAEKAGIRKGDKFLAVNGEPAEYFFDFVREVSKYKGDTVNITLMRDGEEMVIPTGVSALGKIGVGNKPLTEYFHLTKKKYGFFESLPAGVRKAYATIESYVKQFKLVFTKEGVSQVGGFGAIGNMFPSTWNWQMFWSLTAFLSLVLAFMNILPIPALDGGYVLFLLYEMISGRKPSEKFMEYAVLTGIVLLLALLILANGNDVIRLFSK